MESLGSILRRIVGRTSTSEGSRTPGFDLQEYERERTCPHGQKVRLHRSTQSWPWEEENPCRECRRERVKGRLYDASGVPDLYWPGGKTPATFERFDLALNPQMERPLRLAQEYCEDEAPPWLVLVGSPGNGKTHLAKAIAITFLERLARVRLWVVPEFLDRLKATFAPDSERDFEQEMADLAYLPNLVVMDDYGSQSQTPWANERLYLVLNMRYERRLRTVITCNEPRALARDGRIRSRLYDGRLCQLVHCKGIDVRPKLREVR
ncbi:MAG: ATP-binding protein [Chloroflexota bacterium]|nr:ATP-binding protein [Chloroflexota bacterium]